MRREERPTLEFTCFCVCRTHYVYLFANSKMECRICGNETGDQIVRAREMMYGLREVFEYLECSYCGCLQIRSLPDDLSKYYPGDYYSFGTYQPDGWLKRFIKKERNRFAIYNRGFLGRLLYARFPVDTYRVLSEVPMPRDAAIMDVGCGDGTYLLGLKQLGFHRLIGVDPFIKEDLHYDNGVRIVRKTIHEMSGQWDYIMFHHSFEHIADPKETIAAVSRLLAPGGRCIIRTPTVSSYAWEHYRENWVQLDAPRHLHIFSIHSMALLVERAGLQLEKTVFDSTDFQFWGSEQYLRDIPLNDERSVSKSGGQTIFTAEELAGFKQRALALNREGRGDSCAFIVRKQPGT